MDESLRIVVSKLFGDIKESYASTKTIPDCLLLSLQDVFQGVAIPALDLVEHKSITLYNSPSGRKLYSILGSANTPYWLPYTANYCPCYSFRFGVVQQDILLCKHQLAVKLAQCMGEEQIKQVTNEVMFEMIQDMYTIPS